MTGDTAAIVLVVPPDLALDDLTGRRLVERLAASPSDVDAVGALVGSLAPGSSLTTRAEWDATGPAQPLEPVAGTAVEGAVAVRAGVAHTAAGRTVTVQGGRVLVDPGARCLDPAATGGLGATDGPADAGEQARPPFRRRPVVLFLAGGDDLAGPVADLADLVDGLIDHQVEARLATAAAVSGPRLTRICRPTVESWRALRPDVVVLVDEAAAELATAWCDDRATVFVALDPELGTALELVSWTIGQAQGRLRARIGPDVDPARLARLVNRLCSGPQPAPPVDREPGPATATVSFPQARPGAADRDGATDVAESDDLDEATPTAAPHRPDTARHQDRRQVAVTQAVAASPGGAGLVDQLDAAGHAARTLSADPGRAELVDVDLLVVDPEVTAEALAGWLAHAGPQTRAVLVRADALDQSHRPGPDAPWAAAETAGQVLAATPPSAPAQPGARVRVQVAPPLLTRARVAELTTAAARRTAPPAPLFGWWLSPTDPTDPIDVAGPDRADRVAVADALAARLEAQPDAQVEVVGTAFAHPVFDHPRLVVRSRPPDPGGLAAWTAQIWSPPAAVPAGSRPLLEAAFAGVPTVTAAAVEGADGELVVEPADQPATWADRLAALEDDDRRARWSRRAQDRAEALRGPSA